METLTRSGSVAEEGVVAVLATVWGVGSLVEGGRRSRAASQHTKATNATLPTIPAATSTRRQANLATTVP
jgi:hypothetical protein